MGNVASPSKLPVRIGGNIRRYRKFRRWTQERLAEQAGLSTYFIGSVERGQAALSLRSLEQIADALRLPLPLLCEFENDADRKVLVQELEARLAHANTRELKVILNLLELIQRR